MKRRNQFNMTRNNAAASRGSVPVGAGCSTPPPAQSSSRWAVALALLGIALAALAAYCDSFAGPLILDDPYWITNNPSIRHLWPVWPVLFPPNIEQIGGRPVVNLTLAVNYALGGMNVWGYHVANLAIHVLAAWLLFGVVRRTLMVPSLQSRFGSVATPLALVVALLWTLHPLQTAAVTYVIQRTEALVGLFYLLTLYCVIRGATSTRTRLSWYVAAIVSCLLGMATKEVMVTAPLIVLLYDRTFLAGSFREAWRRRHVLYLALAATWSIVAALLLATGFHGGTTGFAVETCTWWSYLLTQPGVIVHYLRLAFWPVGLCLDYRWPAARSLGDVLPPLIMVIGLLVATVWALAKRPAWGFLGAWFFVILAPTSSFVPIQDMAFEHRMYLSLAALVGGAVIGGRMAIDRLVGADKASQIICGGAVLLVGITFGTLTFYRNLDYRSDLAIWEDTTAKSPGNERAHNNLGSALTHCRRFDEAIAQYQKALKIKPDHAQTLNNYGLTLADCGRLDEAIEQYQKAFDVQPDYAEALNNLGNALAASGRGEEAVAQYQKAVDIKPNYAEAHNNLGFALAGRGRIEEAIASYRKTLTIEPDLAAAHNNLGLALAGRGIMDEAIVHYQKALNAQPNYAEAQNNLANALANCGRFDEALDHYQKSLTIKPDYANARENRRIVSSQREAFLQALAERRALLRARPDDLALLNETAWILATNPNASIRNAAEAVELAERAVQLSSGKEPAVLGTLAAAYAEAGRFPEALQTAGKALALATEQGNQPLAESINAKVPLYQSHTPFHEARQSFPAGATQP
jgi:protein O-mannosyl-transferase